jgi:hypothetical protein
MKKAFTFLPLLIFISGKTQTLTQVFNEPKAGDFEYILTADTSAYKTGIPAGPGNNITWDLQLLKTPPASETVSYLDSATVPSASLYPGCKYVMNRPLYFGYFGSDKVNGRTELLGISTSTLSLHFTDPAVILEYPVSFGSMSSDFTSGNFDAGIASGFCAGISQTIADGKGTLKLPAGRTYNDVLRVKTVLQLTLTAGIIPVGNVQQTLIMFYEASNKFPMLSLSYTKLQVMGSPANIITEHTINALKPLGIDEISKDNFEGVILYPNPADEFINVNIPATKSRVLNVEIYDTNGHLIAAEYAGKIDVRRLENGVYTTRIKLADGSIFMRKFLKF